MRHATSRLLSLPILLLGIVVGPIAAAEEDTHLAVRGELTRAARNDLAELHERVAKCLRSDRPAAECQLLQAAANAADVTTNHANAGGMKMSCKGMSQEKDDDSQQHQH